MRKNFTEREINAMTILRNVVPVTIIAKAFDTSTSTVIYHTDPIARANKNRYDCIYNKGRNSIIKKLENR